MIGHILFVLSIIAIVGLCGEFCINEQLKRLSIKDYRYPRYSNLAEFFWITSVISIFSFVLALLSFLFLL